MAIDAAKPAESMLWSRVATILPALNPLLLLVVGAVLNSGIESTKAKIDQNQKEIQNLKTIAETASITSRTQVDKVKVIADFLNELTGPSETRRQVAIQAIFIALPDEAPRLVKVIEQGDGRTAKDAAAARTALDSTRSRLLADMFSDARPARVEALHTLQRAWTDDWTLITQLIDRAMQDVEARKQAKWSGPDTKPRAGQQLASISNVAEFLTTASVPPEPALRAKARAFAEAAKPNSDDTRQFAAVIAERFRN